VECEVTPCILNEDHIAAFPSDTEQETATSDLIIGTSSCSNMSGKNSELSSRNSHASDYSEDIHGTAGPTVVSSSPVSVSISPESHFINAETDVPASNISLVSQDYNFCSDESS
jgi:hypothetical protein